MNAKTKYILLAGSLAISFFTFGQTMEQAMHLTQNEEFQKADAAFKALINAKPADGNLYFYEGENFFNWGQMDSAQAAYQKGIAMNATNALNYTGLGKVQWYKGDSKDALDNFYKAKVISKSKDATVLAKIAEAYINAPTKDINTALELLNQAIVLDANNADIDIDLGDAYLARNDGSSAVNYYDKATSINPKSVVGLLRLGQLYGRARNYELSFQYFQKANKTDSTFAPAHREMAEMLGKAGQYDKAITQYSEYLQLNNSVDARIRYAEFLFLAKKYPDAVSEIQKVMTKDTSIVILYRLMGYALYETGKYKDGLNYINSFFAKAAKANIKILPTDYAYQGKLLSKNGQDSLAIEKMKQAMVKDTDDASELCSQIANIYYKNGNYNMAVQYYQKRTLMPKATVNDYNALGRAAYSNNQFQKADSAFAVITKYMPDLPLGYLWRARSNARIDSLTTLGLAKPYYEQYITKVGTDTIKNRDGLLEAYKTIAYYYFLQKDKDNTAMYYKKALALDPNDVQVKQYFDSLKPRPQGKKEGNK